MKHQTKNLFTKKLLGIIPALKNLKKSFFLIILCCLVLPSINLLGNGFAAKTPVVCKKGKLRAIEDIAEDLWSFPRVMSFSFKTCQAMRGKVRAAGYCLSDCYLCMSFEEPQVVIDYNGQASLKAHASDIHCSPLQEFYLPQENKWIPAHELSPGAVLQSYYHGAKTLLAVELVQRRIELFILEVKRRHNFFVGTYGILVHNDAIPWGFSLNISCAWGAGALAGAKSGSRVGPVGLAVGLVIGGIAGYFVDSGEIKKVDVAMEPHLIEELLNKNNPETQRRPKPSYPNIPDSDAKKSPDKKPDEDEPDPKKPKNDLPGVPPGKSKDRDDQKTDARNNLSNNNNPKTKDDILAESRLDKESKELIQYEKKGTYEDALNDFKSLNTEVMRDIKNPKYPGRDGWVGKNGETKITVRNLSTTPDKAPTLEFQCPHQKVIKIRYKKA